MNIDGKIPNKIQQTEFNGILERLYTIDQGGFIPGIQRWFDI